MEEAMATATYIFTKKPAAPKRGTLPHHLWPKSVRHDVSRIRQRVKTIRRLASLAMRNLEATISDTSSHIALWQEVNTSLPLRTNLSPPPRNLASLGLSHWKDLSTIDNTSPSNRRHLAVLAFKVYEEQPDSFSDTSATFAAFDTARLGYACLPKNRADTSTLPTDLLVIRDETTDRLINAPEEVVAKIAQLETVSLSPAFFPWIGHVFPTPSSSIPMISGCITPIIMQEALRRTPSYKAAGPDVVPGLILKHMPPAFHEALHLLFHSIW